MFFCGGEEAQTYYRDTQVDEICNVTKFLHQKIPRDFEEMLSVVSARSVITAAI
jgi:hypothetical protein